MNEDHHSGSSEEGSEATNPPFEEPAAAGALPLTTSVDSAPASESEATSHRRRWVIGAAAALVLVVGGVVAVVTLSSKSTGITTGAGTAKITWVPVKGGNDTVLNSPQPFTGTIDGLSASGIATTPISINEGQKIANSGQLPTRILFFRWKGTFGGKPFTINIYVSYPPGTALADSAEAIASLTIGGEWGKDRVKGRVLTPTAAELKKGNPPVHFTGTVGDLKVVGTVRPPVGGRGHPSSTATFTVSK